MTLTGPVLDDRTDEQLRDELIARIPVYTPEWTDQDGRSYPWLAFVRRRGAAREPEAHDEVEVVVAGTADAEAFADRVAQVVANGPAAVPGDWTPRSMTVSYPRDAWALPVPDEAYAMVHDDAIVSHTQETAVVICVRAPSRRPLGFARATLLAGAFDGSDRRFDPPRHPAAGRPRGHRRSGPARHEFRPGT